jgi:hypothetical protein
MFFMAGVMIAAEHTIVSYNKDTKEGVFKDKDGKEVKGKLTDKTKITVIDKDGNKTEGKLENIVKNWSGDKVAGKKTDITIVNGEITEVTVKKNK